MGHALALSYMLMDNLRDGSRPQVRLEVALDALIGRIVGRPDLRLSQEEMMDVLMFSDR